MIFTFWWSRDNFHNGTQSTLARGGKSARGTREYPTVGLFVGIFISYAFNVFSGNRLKFFYPGPGKWRSGVPMAFSTILKSSMGPHPATPNSIDSK